MFVLTEETAKQREFWLHQLSSELPENVLIPEVINKSNQLTLGVDTIEFSIEQDVYNRLKLYCNDSHFLWYCFLLTGLNLCLYKYSGQYDQLLGSPMRGNSAETGDILPIRSIIDSEMSFKELVLQVRETMAAAYTNQKFPLGMLFDELELSNETGINSLFNVVASMEGFHTSLPTNTNEKLIHLLFSLSSEQLLIKIQYPTGIFSNVTIQRFAEHLNEVLKSSVHHIDKAVKELSICSTEEESIILNKFNPLVTAFKENSTITELFEHQVLTQPNNTALIHNGKEITYRDLDEKSNQLASNLRTHLNIQSNEFVAVCMNRGIDYVISILAVLKAGAAYVPLDKDYPDERIQFILEDSNAKLLLTDNKNQKELKVATPVLEISELSHLSEQIENTSLTKPDDLAYLLYTSGTTGVPKGILIEQRNVINLVTDTDYLTFNEKTTMIQTTPIVFDISTLEIWGTLLNGGTLVVVDKQTLLEPKELKKTIELHKVNSAALNTALFHHLASHHTEVFTGLEQLLTGGETISSVLTDKTLDMHKDLKLINAYGPTECTVLVTAHNVTRSEQGGIPIGKPISRTKIFITGVDGQIQPIGVPGEMFISGNSVGRSYLNRPEMTEKHFIPDYYEQGCNMYRTGDLGRWREDGSIEFLGRKDRQIKLRGYRIELGEIENTLMKHQDILEAVVIPIKNNEESILCAYVVLTENEKARESELINYLKTYLPDYMIPSAIVSIEQIPFQVNGKVDLSKLPEPIALGTEFQQQNSHALPQSDEEKKVAAIWSSLLGKPQIGIYQNFFELGGHSLKLIILAEELQKEGYTLNTMDLYKYPTISSFLEFQRTLKQ